MEGYEKKSYDLWARTWDKRKSGGKEGPFKTDWLRMERRIYHAIAGNLCIKTICEIGFFTGHSTLLWLMANPKAMVISFDLWEHPHASVGEKFIRDLPGINASRWFVYKGDSAKVIKSFNQRHPNIVCDLISVDGSHVIYEMNMDVRIMKNLANRFWNVLVIDDTCCGASYCVNAVVEENEMLGHIRKLKEFPLAQGRRGVTIMHYIYNNSI